MKNLFGRMVILQNLIILSSKGIPSKGSNNNLTFS